MKVKLIVEGGAMKPGPAVAQQLGPMGINLGKVIEDVNKATDGFKGMKVSVEVDVDLKTKNFEIEVFSPPIAELVKKELGLEKASGQTGKVWAGNIAFETLLGIAKTKLPNLPVRNLRMAMNLAIGTCTSLGILIDNESPKEIMKNIRSGKYESILDGEKTEVSVEKKVELEKFFNELKIEQDKNQKAVLEAKAAEEEKKAVAPVVEGTKTDVKKEEQKKGTKKK